MTVHSAEEATPHLPRQLNPSASSAVRCPASVMQGLLREAGVALGARLLLRDQNTNGRNKASARFSLLELSVRGPGSVPAPRGRRPSSPVLSLCCPEYTTSTLGSAVTESPGTERTGSTGDTRSKSTRRARAAQRPRLSHGRSSLQRLQTLEWPGPSQDWEGF